MKCLQQVLLSLDLKVCLQGVEDVDTDSHVDQDGDEDDDQYPCSHRGHGTASETSPSHHGDVDLVLSLQ